MGLFIQCGDVILVSGHICQSSAATIKSPYKIMMIVDCYDMLSEIVAWLLWPELVFLFYNFAGCFLVADGGSHVGYYSSCGQIGIPG